MFNCTVNSFLTYNFVQNNVLHVSAKFGANTLDIELLFIFITTAAHHLGILTPPHTHTHTHNRFTAVFLGPPG